LARIVAAMSGGVDSSVAAALLARDAAAEGHEVVGVWMRTHPDRGEGWEPRRGCCSSEAADDARRAADRIGIPFFILNVEAEFGSLVIDAFADAYLEGTTPNPCQACNQYIKFDLLARRAVGAYGAEAVATGHYARVEHREGAWRLLRAVDRGKDQTYFLWNLDQRQLAATRFPLGEMTKPQVRQLAADLELPTAATPESQEICFVPAGDYRALLEERRAYSGVAGPIVDGEGRQVGIHSGYAHYTIGQRRGLGTAASNPRYVREIRPERNEVVVGTRDDLAVNGFAADARHFIAGDPPADRFEAEVRIRHRSEDVACEVTVVGADRLVVETAEPVWAPAPGQSAVLYRGDECLGGGRIIRA
jgi:tRNA-specific 2-thiouridylase